MRCAIYGAGSLGVALGAMIARDGTQIQLVSGDAAVVRALNQYGAAVAGRMNFTVPVDAVLPEEMDGKYDIIFLTAKANENGKHARFLKKYLSKSGFAVSLQAGLPEFEIVRILGEKRTLGAVAGMRFLMTEPGVSVLLSDPKEMKFEIGWIPGNFGFDVAKAASVLQKAAPVYYYEDLMGPRWTRLLLDAAVGGMSAVIGTDVGKALKNRACRSLMLAAMKEGLEICRAAEVELAKYRGADLDMLCYYTDPVHEKIASEALATLLRKDRGFTSPMLTDILSGRATEADDIFGSVILWGEYFGIETPVHETMREIIKAAEAGEIGLTEANLELFGEEA